MRCLVICFIMLSSLSIFSQNGPYKFYLRANSTNLIIDTAVSKGRVVYLGKDRDLIKVFNNNNIIAFRKAFVNSNNYNLKRTWYFESSSNTTLSDFLVYASHVFNFGEKIEDVILANTYPNDYGITSPNGYTGLPVDLSYFDFIEVPLAWDYTTGSTNTNIRVGISDGGITSNAPDFVNQIIANGVLSNGTSDEDIRHGNTITMILAGEGNNGQGSTGICQDCEIISHYFLSDNGNNGLSLYEKIEDLALNGARVINCSFEVGYSQTGEDCIAEVTDNLGSIVVAASGNSGSEVLRYPASYNNVISVGAVGAGKDFIFENIEQSGTGFPYIKNLKHALGGNVGFNNNSGPITPSNFEEKAFILGGRARLNEKVDIVAPGLGVFSYGQYLSFGNISYVGAPNFQTLFTSPATPMVSGTIALMLDLNSCLDLVQIESIIKSSSTYISDFPFNTDSGNNFVWAQKHGSGTLNVGRAVKLVNDLLDSSEIAYINNQKFTRWDFEFEGVSQHIEIRNQEFTEASTLSVIAKNRILIEENSLLEPNSDGNALLDINPSLVINTDCIPPGVAPPNCENGSNKDQEEDSRYKIAPTKVINEMSIYERFSGEQNLTSIKIYDLMNREVFASKGLNFKSNEELTFNLQILKRGIYIVKGFSSNGEEVLTEKIIKL